MTKNKAISLALFALAFSAQAATVSLEQAKVAAQNWASAGDVLGVRIGRIATTAVKYAEAGEDGGAYYAVKFAGGGTVIMSSDTEHLPVVAFTSGSMKDGMGPAAQALLKYDARARKAWAKIAKEGATPQALALKKQVAKNERLWAALLGESTIKSSSEEAFLGSVALAGEEPTTYEPAKPLASLDDIRVDVLLETKWSQGASNGGYCYNYYTPNHYVCGCVATATSQVMRYWRFPVDELPQHTGACSIGGDGRKGGGTSIMLTTRGGKFEWDKMVSMDTQAFVPEACRAAIGHLTSDVGIYIGMHYTAGESGASVGPGFFTGNMGYASAASAGGSDIPFGITKGLHRLDERQRALYTNFDAKRPVLMSISGYELVDGKLPDPLPKETDSAHEVVSDGYGYHTIDGEKVDFVHVNMGWGGSDDMWYNLPDINAANTGATINSGGTDFCYLDGIVYNIHPTETGNLITGRVSDDYGTPMAGARVVAVKQGTSEELETTTDDNGIYYFAVPNDGGLYDIKGVFGEFSGSLVGVKTTTTIDGSEKINSWGNDFILVKNAVKVGEYSFTSIDKAYEFIGKNEGFNSIEIVGPTALNQYISITSDVSIVYNGAGYGFVDRSSEVTIEVFNNAKVVLKNVVFANAASTPITVNDGILEVSGVVSSDELLSIGVDAGATFLLGGDITGGIRLEKVGAMDKAAVFGTSASAVIATANAGKIYNAENIALAGVADGTNLKWGEAEAPVADAAVAKVGSVYYRSLDAALAAGLTGELDVLKSDVLANSISISGAFTIKSSNGATIRPNAGVSISVENGGSLILKDIVVADFNGLDSLFKIVGAGSTLTLESGAMLKGLTTNRKDQKVPGPIFVDNEAEVVMKDGAVITGCRVLSKGNSESSGYGGGIYLQRGSVLNMVAGGAITNCYAIRGAGVYVDKSTVRLGGNAIIKDNAAGNYGNNIYLANDRDDMISIEAALTGGPASIGVTGKYGVEDKNAIGGVIGVKTISADETTLAAFFNDIDNTLYAVANGDVLCWDQSDVGGDLINPATPDVVNAVAIVYYNDGDTPTYWRTFDAAITNLTKAATIGLLKDCTLGVSKEFDFSVSLTTDSSVAAGPVNLIRVKSASDKDPCLTITGSGNQLSIANLQVLGSENAVCNVGSPMGRIFYAKGNASLIFDNKATVVNVFSTTDSMACDATAAIIVKEGAIIGNSSNIVARGAIDLNGGISSLRLDGNAVVNITGELSGSIVVECDDDVFGVVDPSFTDTDKISVIAYNFIRKSDGCSGVAVTNAAGKAALVWKPAVAENGTIVIDDETYTAMIMPVLPFSITKINYDNSSNKWQLTISPVVKGHTYKVYSTTSIDGGSWQYETKKTATTDDDLLIEVSGPDSAKYWKCEVE